MGTQLLLEEDRRTDMGGGGRIPRRLAAINGTVIQTGKPCIIMATWYRILLYYPDFFPQPTIGSSTMVLMYRKAASFRLGSAPRQKKKKPTTHHLKYQPRVEVPSIISRSLFIA